MKTKIKKTHKIILLASIVSLSGLAIFYLQAIKSPTEIQTTASEDGRNLNLNPATKEERKQADDNKKRLNDENDKLKNQKRPTPDNKTMVKPEITRSEQSINKIEIGSVVPSIFESGGVCVAQLTKESKTVMRQVVATAEGRSTFCPLIQIPASEFLKKGNWTLTVTYNSAVYSGISNEVTIEIK